MPDLFPAAPQNHVTDYDRRQLALYAALLDAEAAGMSWQAAAATVMQIDPDQEGSASCWESHIARARWIIGNGLGQAIEKFSKSENARRP